MKHNTMENLTEQPLQEVNIKQSYLCEEIGKWKEGIVKYVSRPKNGLHLFCQFNLCFSFFKLSIVYKNSFTTSV